MLLLADDLISLTSVTFMFLPILPLRSLTKTPLPSKRFSTEEPSNLLAHDPGVFEPIEASSLTLSGTTEQVNLRMVSAGGLVTSIFVGEESVWI